MSSVKPGRDILPFIVEEGKTTPIQSLDFSPTNTNTLVFNLPIDVLQPIAYNLSGKLDKTAYDVYATLLGFLSTLHVCNYMEGYGEDTSEQTTEGGGGGGGGPKPKTPKDPDTRLQFREDGKPKTEVYMEYVLRDNVVVEDEGATPNLSECTAIRFFFVDYDSGGVLYDRCAKLAAYFQKLTKNSKPKSDKDKPLPFEFCKSVTSMDRLAELICEYMCEPSYKYSAEQIKDTESPADFGNVFAVDYQLPPNSMQSQTGYPVNDKNNRVLNFAYPHLVFKIEHFMLPTPRLFGVTLPGTTEWSPQTGQDLAFTRSSLSNLEYMRSILSRSPPVSNGYRQITISRELNETRLIGTIHNDPQRLKRQMRMNNLQHACRCEAALSTGVTLGEDLEAYAKFAGTFTEFQKPLIKIFDPTLSFFANYMCTEWMVYENFYHLACNHRVLKVLELAALDSLRDAKDLRPNILIPGNGETGKSFLLDKVRARWVDGTCPEVTALTENSFITNEPTLFNIMLFHEVPELIMGTGNTGREGPTTGSGVIKDVLTRNEVSKKTCYVEDGQRLQINTTCEYEAVMLMATNEATGQMPAPIVSRMLILNIIDYKKDYGTRAEKAAPVDPTEQARLDSHVETYHSRFRQQLIAQLYVELLIKFKVLDDVDVSTSVNVIDVASEYCRKVGLVDWGNRVNDSVRAMIRTQTIQYAIIRYLSMLGKPDGPTSMANTFATFAPKYDTQGNITHRGIQPFLVATEELCVFVVSCIFESYDGTVDYMVMEAILNALIMSNPRNRVSGSYEIKLGVSNGTMYEFDMGQTNYHVMVESVVRYLAKHSRYKISKEQVKTSFDNLRQHGLCEINMGEVKINWVRLRDLYKVVDEKYRFNMDTKSHIEEICSKISHSQFANNTRLLISSPIDVNHQDIMSEIEVNRVGPYKRIVSETRCAMANTLEDAFGPCTFGNILSGPSGDVGAELLALRRILPEATQADVGRLLYDNMVDDIPSVRYPEEYLEHAYTQIPLVRYPSSKPARKRGSDTIERYNALVEKTLEANPAENHNKRIRIDN